MKLNLSKRGVETLIVSLEEEAVAHQELASLWETRAKFLEEDLAAARAEVSELQRTIAYMEVGNEDEF